MGWPLPKYTSHSIQPVRSAHGSTRKVAGSGTTTTSGKPVNSSMPKPPPRANAGTNTWLPVSRLKIAPEKSSPSDMAAMAASGDSILPRGTPCWSTTASRTVRKRSSRMRAITSCARASRSGEASPCRPTNPGCPTPEGSMLTRLNNAVNRSRQARRQAQAGEDRLGVEEVRQTAEPPAPGLVDLQRPRDVPARRVRLVLSPRGHAVDLARGHQDRVAAQPRRRLDHPPHDVRRALDPQGVRRHGHDRVLVQQRDQ